MLPISIPPDCIAIFRLNALDSAESQKPATGTITIDLPDMGYVAYNPGGQLVFVTKQIPGAGTIVPVTMSVSGVNSIGAGLSFSQVFEVNGPPDPDPATHFSITEGPLVRDKVGYPIPPDSGPTIPLQ